MSNDTKSTKPEKPEVWFSYRSKGSDTVHRVRVKGAIANRWAKRMINGPAYVYDIVTPTGDDKPLKRVQPSKRVDYLNIEGIYERELKAKASTEAKIHLQVSQSRVYHEAKQREDQEDYEQQLIARRIRKTGKITTQRMSFHVGRLDQSIIILCPITGIIGKLEMPYCPVALQYEHPLAKPGNVLTLLRYHFSPKGQKEEIAYLSENSRLKLDRQTLAGCVLSLLRAKGLLVDDGETSANERNMVLQNAGFEILNDFLKETVRVWDNAQIWKRIPKLRADWKVHAAGADTNIGATLQAMLKVIKTALDPQQLTQEEQSRIFAAQRRKQEQRDRYNSVKIYSASAVESRKIKESKSEGREIFDTLKPQLPIAARITISRVLKDLLILPASVKLNAAILLRKSFIGKPQQSLANRLAVIIESAENKALMEELGTLSMEVSPAPSKSISDILANKKAKREDREQSQEEKNNGGN